MIYTVTFNPSIDYIVTVDHFVPGRVNRTIKERILPGGKGINVSWVLHNLGYESTALGFVAGFTGEHLQTLLQEKGITTDLIRVEEGMSRINVKIRSDWEQQEESEINGMGPVVDETAIRKLYEKLDPLQSGDILVLAGSVPTGLSASVYREIMSRLKSKNLRIVVDAAGDLLLEVLPYHPFLIKPNNHELGELFGVTIRDKEEAIFYGRKLQDMGARNVLISMGADGAVLVAEDTSVHRMDAPCGKVVNAVGAGDSMVAGFLAGFLDKEDYAYALRMGACAGSASAFSEDLATGAEVMALFHAEC